MNRKIEKVFEFLFGPEILGSQPEKLELREMEVKIITTGKPMLEQLELCRRSGGLIGVYSPLLGRGMFLTAVEDIDRSSEGVRVVFKPYDMNGNFLERSTLLVREISGICPFNQVYVEPRVFDNNLSVVAC